jgi:hypothetical protein
MSNADMPSQPHEEIWLQWFDEEGDPVADEVCWCTDKIYETDVSYTRTDIVESLRAEITDAAVASRLKQDRLDTYHDLVESLRQRIAELEQDAALADADFGKLEDDNASLRAQLAEATTWQPISWHPRGNPAMTIQNGYVVSGGYWIKLPELPK